MAIDDPRAAAYEAVNRDLAALGETVRALVTEVHEPVPGSVRQEVAAELRRIAAGFDAEHEEATARRERGDGSWEFYALIQCYRVRDGLLNRAKELEQS